MITLHGRRITTYSHAHSNLFGGIVCPKKKCNDSFNNLLRNKSASFMIIDLGPSKWVKPVGSTHLPAKNRWTGFKNKRPI